MCWALTLVATIAAAASLIGLFSAGHRAANCMTSGADTRDAALVSIGLALVAGAVWSVGRALGQSAGPDFLWHRWWPIGLGTLLALPLFALVVGPISPAAAESRAMCSWVGARSTLAVMALSTPLAAIAAGELLARRARLSRVVVCVWGACAAVAAAAAWVPTNAMGANG